MSFLNISPAECLKIYPAIAANAEELFQSAELLAQRKRYGKAISLSILSVEESVKAFILHLEGKGFRIRSQPGIKTIFRNHWPRHSVLRDTYSVWMVLKRFFDMKPPYTGRKLIQQALLTMISILPAHSNNQWWENADDLKNRGLYADYETTLLLPTDFTESDYQTARRFIDPVRKDIATFSKKLDLMREQQLNDFIQLFSESNLTELIVESFTRKTKNFQS